jgi:hypothetical protein
MSIILQIPCDESGKLGRVEIARSLDMTFLDYDLEYDLAFEAMGGDNPSFCLQAYKTWQDNPMGFLCGSGLVPVAHLGVMSCGLVREAVPIVEAAIGRNDEHLSCLKYALGLADVCGKQFRRVRRDISRVYHWQQDLTKAWNARVSGGKRSYEMPGFGEQILVDAALNCADMVTKFWERMEWNEGWSQPPSQPCIIAEMVRNGIASTTYRNLGLYHPEGFRGLLTPVHPGLVDELTRISRMEAEWAVKILEGLK